MFNKSLIISLGVTSLAGIAIWFYFKDRLVKIEKKFDLMFNIFQENQKTTQVLNGNLNKIANDFYKNDDEEEQDDIVEEEVKQENEKNNDLISISDNETQLGTTEEQYYTTDSEVVSDAESENDILHIDNSLDGEEFVINGADLGTSENLISVMNNVIGGMKQNIENYNTNDNIEIINDEVDSVNLSNQTHLNLDTINIKETTNEVIDGELSDNETDDGENNETDDGENNEIDDGFTTQELTNSENKDNSIIDIHDPKTTVKILKALASAKGLRSRGLKKEKLIELLENNQ